ncbi:hypothetical protein HC744_03565 [Arthrobacter sp. S1_S22]|nr:hypothetical protein [Arthrobacter sp. S1_S22]
MSKEVFEYALPVHESTIPTPTDLLSANVLAIAWEMLGLATRLSDSGTSGVIRANLAAYYRFTGQGNVAESLLADPAAAQAFTRVLSREIKAGDPSIPPDDEGHFSNTLNTAVALIRHGRYEEAVSYLMDAEQSMTLDDVHKAILRDELALAYGYLGRHAEADRLLQESAEVFVAAGEWMNYATNYQIRSRSFLQRRQIENAFSLWNHEGHIVRGVAPRVFVAESLDLLPHIPDPVAAFTLVRACVISAAQLGDEVPREALTQLHRLAAGLAQDSEVKNFHLGEAARHESPD